MPASYGTPPQDGDENDLESEHHGPMRDEMDVSEEESA
jgi:hypothetical protein